MSSHKTHPLAYGAVLSMALTAAASAQTVDLEVSQVDVSSTGEATLAGKALYRAKHLNDGRAWSAWGSRPADREGAWINLRFDHVQYVSQIEFVPGDARDKTGYKNCGRPAQIAIETASGQRRVELKDRRYQQIINLKAPVRGSEVRLRFTAVHGQSAHGGVCLSELVLRGPKHPLQAVPGLRDTISSAVQELADDYRAPSAEATLRSIGWPAAADLRRALKGRNATLIARAAKLLGEMGDKAAKPALVRLAGSTDRELRAASRWALGALQATEHFDMLRTWFDGSHGKERDLAFDALARLGDPRAMDLVVSQLVDGNRARTQSAAKHLGRYGEAAIASLDPLLTSSVTAERAAATRALGSVAHPQADLHLQTGLAAPQSEIRAAAILGLADRSGAGARSLIRGRWGSRYLDERLAVARVLGRFGHGGDLEILELLASDSSMSVRKAAAKSLGQLGAPATRIVRSLALQGPDGATANAAAMGYLKGSGIERAIELLGSRHAEVRDRAGQVLGAAGEAGQNALVTALLGQDARVRTAAGEQLARIGSRILPKLLQRAGLSGPADPDVLRLIAQFRDPLAESYAIDRLRNGKDLTIRRAAAVALGACGRARTSASSLVAALDDSSEEVRLASIEALGRLKAARSSPQLVAQLSDKSRAIQRASVKALGQMRATAAVSALATHYENAKEDARMREEVVLAAAKIGGRASLPLLVGAVEDTSSRVSRLAELALE